MTNNKFYQAMIHAVSLTLENMIFLEAMEHCDRSYEIPAEDAVWTSLLISDPVQGEIRLVMASDTLQKFTDNVFGFEVDEITDAQRNDILNELLNTIAGLFMTNLLEADKKYQLGLPELGVGELPEPEADTVVWKLMSSEEDAIFIYASGASLVALNN